MATLKTRDIETSLLRKGFGPKDGDHKFFVYYIGEKKTRIFTNFNVFPQPDRLGLFYAKVVNYAI